MRKTEFCTMINSWRHGLGPLRKSMQRMCCYQGQSCKLQVKFLGTTLRHIPHMNGSSYGLPRLSVLLRTLRRPSARLCWSSL